MVTRFVPAGLALAASLLSGVPGCADVLDIRTTRHLASASERTCQGTLRVRVLYDITGSTREVAITAGKGVVDHLRSIEASGGIRGCHVEFDVADSAYTPATALAAYRDWASRPEWAEVSTIMAAGTPITQALAPLADVDKKLIVSTAFNGELAAPVETERNVGVPSLSAAFAEATLPVVKRSRGYRRVFFQATDYTTAARVAMSHIWKLGAKRVGFFACTTSAFCTDPVDGAKSFLSTLGNIKVGRDLAIELTDDERIVSEKTERYFAEEQAHAADDPSYTPVDWIWFGNTRATLPFVGRALAKVKAASGSAPRVIADNWAIDEKLYSECQDACVGFLGVQPVPVFGDMSSSGMARLLAVHGEARVRDNEPATAHAAVEYVYGYVSVAAWRAAVESVVDTGARVDSDSLGAAFERFRRQSIDDLATITYTETDHRPQSTARVYSVGATGRLEPIGPAAAIALQPDWLGW